MLGSLLSIFMKQYLAAAKFPCFSFVSVYYYSVWHTKGIQHVVCSIYIYIYIYQSVFIKIYSYISLCLSFTCLEHKPYAQLASRPFYFTVWNLFMKYPQPRSLTFRSKTLPPRVLSPSIPQGLCYPLPSVTWLVAMLQSLRSHMLMPPSFCICIMAQS